MAVSEIRYTVKIYHFVRPTTPLSTTAASTHIPLICLKSTQPRPPALKIKRSHCACQRARTLHTCTRPRILRPALNRGELPPGALFCWATARAECDCTLRRWVLQVHMQHSRRLRAVLALHNGPLRGSAGHGLPRKNGTRAGCTHVRGGHGCGPSRLGRYCCYVSAVERNR